MGGVVGVFLNSDSKMEVSLEAKESWEKIKQIGPEVLGKAMFKSLFVEHPETFLMFKSFAGDEDWENSRGFNFHSRAVICMIGNAVVSSCKQDEDQLRNSLSTVGKAHAFFGLRQQHFDALGRELVIQLKVLLGESCTEPIIEHWSSCYTRVQKMLLHAMSTNSNSRTA